MTILEDLERELPARLGALVPHLAPNYSASSCFRTSSAGRIGEFFRDSRSRTFAELLIDLEESLSACAFVPGMLRENECEPNNLVRSNRDSVELDPQSVRGDGERLGDLSPPDGER